MQRRQSGSECQKEQHTPPQMGSSLAIEALWSKDFACKNAAEGMKTLQVKYFFLIFKPFKVSFL